MLSTKPGKCRHCKQRLDKIGQKLHDDCVSAWWAANQAKIRAKVVKADKVATKGKLEKLKTPSKWEDECRQIVQKYARIRDRNDGCISCELPANWDGQWHGSHFRSHGAASAVQFNLWNIHKSCWICNKIYSGRIDGYEPRLVAKIGQDKVDWLKSQNQIVRHDVDYYKRFKAVMGKKLRRLEKRIKND